MENYKKQTEQGNEYTKIEEFYAYISKDNKDLNITEYEYVVETTAEMIQQWIDEGIECKSIPEIIKNLSHLNNLLAHKPWGIQENDIKETKMNTELLCRNHKKNL